MCGLKGEDVWDECRGKIEKRGRNLIATTLPHPKHYGETNQAECPAVEEGGPAAGGFGYSARPGAGDVPMLLLGSTRSRWISFLR